MIAGRPADYRDVVHAGRLDTRVFLLAGELPCIRLRDEAARPEGRDYRTADLGGLEDVEPPQRFLVAAILCPGEDTEILVAWMRRRGVDAGRVFLVLHPETDAVAALAPWYEAGHADPVFVEADRWSGFAKDLGRFVNDWIYADAKGTGWPL